MQADLFQGFPPVTIRSPKPFGRGLASLPASARRIRAILWTKFVDDVHIVHERNILSRHTAFCGVPRYRSKQCQNFLFRTCADGLFHYLAVLEDQ